MHAGGNGGQKTVSVISLLRHSPATLSTAPDQLVDCRDSGPLRLILTGCRLLKLEHADSAGSRCRLIASRLSLAVGDNGSNFKRFHMILDAGQRRFQIMRQRGDLNFTLILHIPSLDQRILQRRTHRIDGIQRVVKLRQRRAVNGKIKISGSDPEVAGFLQRR